MARAEAGQAADERDRAERRQGPGLAGAVDDREAAPGSPRARWSPPRRAAHAARAPRRPDRRRPPPASSRRMGHLRVATGAAAPRAGALGVRRVLALHRLGDRHRREGS